MASPDLEGTEPDLAIGMRTKRSAYVFRQTVRSFLYISYALLLLFLAIVWTVLITFSILPIICVRRGYRKVPEYYTPVFKVQRDIYRAYRAAVHRDWLERDFEMGKPQPIGLQQRGFKSHEGKMLVQQDSTPLLSLPAELRLQIYREVITGDSNCVRIATHRKTRPRGKRSIYKTRGQPSWEDPSQIPPYDCGCFYLQPCPYWTPQCHHASPRHLGRGLLALSKTCRQMYMETIDLLYS